MGLTSPFWQWHTAVELRAPAYNDVELQAAQEMLKTPAEHVGTRTRRHTHAVMTMHATEPLEFRAELRHKSRLNNKCCRQHLMSEQTTRIMACRIKLVQSSQRLGAHFQYANEEQFHGCLRRCIRSHFEPWEWIHLQEVLHSSANLVLDWNELLTVGPSFYVSFTFTKDYSDRYDDPLEQNEVCLCWLPRQFQSSGLSPSIGLNVQQFIAFAFVIFIHTPYSYFLQP